MTENPTAPAAPPAQRRTGPPHRSPTATSRATAEWPRSSPPDAPAAAQPRTAVAPARRSAPASAPQSSLAAPRGLSYAVDIVFCIDVTGSMTPILDAVKANALGFYDDVQTNLTAKGKNVAQLRVRVVAFRDFVADGDAALEESPFFTLPDERNAFSRVRQRPDRPGRRRRTRVGPGSGGAGHQLARGPRPVTVGGRSSSSGPTSPPTRSTRRWCRPTSPPGCPPTSAPSPTSGRTSRA